MVSQTYGRRSKKTIFSLIKCHHVEEDLVDEQEVRQEDQDQDLGDHPHVELTVEDVLEDIVEGLGVTLKIQ